MVPALSKHLIKCGLFCIFGLILIIYKLHIVHKTTMDPLSTKGKNHQLETILVDRKGITMQHFDSPIFDLEMEQNKLPSSRESDLAERIRQLVSKQSFCILCTQGESQPYGSLIAYAFTDDLKQFYFTTAVATRKYHLLTHCPRVALVIDSRCQHLDDMTQVDAVTITGKATQIRSGADYDLGISLLKNRHPYLANFLDSASTALFRTDVVRYFHVTRFQEVSQWIP